MTLERPRPMPRFEFIDQHGDQYPSLDGEAMRTYLTVRKLTTRIDQAMDTHLARHDLSFGRFMVLVSLLQSEAGDARPAMTPAQLSERCGVTRATMTGLLDALEKAKHIARTEDPHDGRSSQVRLTPRGHKFLDGMLPDHFSRLAKMMRVLSTDEMTTLRQMLERLFAAAHELETT